MKCTQRNASGVAKIAMSPATGAVWPTFPFDEVAQQRVLLQLPPLVWQRPVRLLQYRVAADAALDASTTAKNTPSATAILLAQPRPECPGNSVR